MAFDATSAVKDRRILVEVALDTTTLRYADIEVALSDNNRYAGRLLRVSELRRAIGRLLDPRLMAPRMQITLDNKDDQVRTDIDTYEIANREVTIKIGQGTTASDYETVFIGTIDFPTGVQWDQQQVVITLNDRVNTDQRTLPINKFFPADYPNMEDKSKFLPIPYVYGDWRTTAGGGETVPAFQTDSTQGTGGEFTLCDHALKEIEVVYLNGSDITANCTLDASTGTFVLDSDAYDPDTDTVTANVQGATDDGTTGGTLLQTLPDILEDLLKTHLGVDASKIDSTAFSDWEGELTANDYGRAVIGVVKSPGTTAYVANEVSSTTLISQILVEGFADMAIIAGKYKPSYRVVSLASDIPTFRDVDIKNHSGGTKDFRVERDEEKVYANQIVAEYRKNPTGGGFAQRYDTEDTAAINKSLARRRRRLEMHWLYITTGAQSRADREKYVFASEIETVFLGISSRAVLKNPTDQFRLIFSKYEIDTNVGTPFQIREINTNPMRLSSRIKAWNMTQLSPGRWTASTHPTWTNSTAFQRASAGYWTDVSGYADPSASPDVASQRSIWF